MRLWTQVAFPAGGLLVGRAVVRFLVGCGCWRRLGRAVSRADCSEEMDALAIWGVVGIVTQADVTLSWRW